MAVSITVLLMENAGMSWFLTSLFRRGSPNTELKFMARQVLKAKQRKLLSCLLPL
jgi:hypothetical protein